MKPSTPRSRRAAPLFAIAIALAASCSSPAGGEPALASSSAGIRVSLIDYDGGQNLELASRSHTDRVELYSTARPDASLKVPEDIYMAGLLEFFELEGFAGLALAGAAPGSGRDLLTRAIEVEREGERRYIAISRTSPPEDRVVFNTCMQGFLELYNATQAYQRVESEGGTDLFGER